ncbi:uncharacterized protein LOC112163789 [Rosa chinensis]|uniref:uncharacterized protein LOC112163789 n=1 Tax=Rosa chinensis TaxID=74649 RepID=UPI000D093CEC|nr:uncharacterized protein LOC112163789 [Rosa chinensis]
MADKEGGVVRNFRQMLGLVEALDLCLSDVKFVEPKFTWHGIRSGHLIKIRLDRFMACQRWKDFFGASRVVHLNPSTSDYLPILLEIREIRQRQRKRKKRFRFEEFWLKEEECKKVVESGWEKAVGSYPFLKICNKIDLTRKALEKWSSNQFGSLKRNIEDTRAKLAVFYDSTQFTPPIELKFELEAKLNNLLQQELLFWRERAKVFWLQDDDANAKFFHQRASNRKKKNCLHGLFDDYGA